MNIEQAGKKVIALTRSIWILVLLIATVSAALYYPSWVVLLLIIPFSIVSYWVILCVVLFGVSGFVTHAKVNEDAALRDFDEKQLKAIRDKIEKAGLKGTDALEAMQSAGFVSLTKLANVSEEILGQYDGEPMYAWIEIQDPTTHQLERFMYFGLSLYDDYGIPVTPLEEGKVYAHVDGKIYARDIQPV